MMGSIQLKIQKLAIFAQVFFWVSLSAVTQVHAGPSGSYQLVSDIDDTLKITNVLSPARAVWNGLFENHVFSGMSYLFNQLSQNASEVVYLSGSPPALAKKIRKDLFEEHWFPVGVCEFYNWLSREKLEDFKLNKLRKKAGESSLPFLLFGDDTQSDPEIFDQLRKDFGEKSVLRAYVHQIKGRALPASVIPYVTAFDVALKEVEAQNISPEEAIQIGHSIMNENHQPELLFPPYVFCPTDFVFQVGELGSKNSDLVTLSKRMTDYVFSICSSR